jgi:hypothetical protein
MYHPAQPSTCYPRSYLCTRLRTRLRAILPSHLRTILPSHLRAILPSYLYAYPLNSLILRHLYPTELAV